jgi:hypothetical protein
MPTKRNDFPHPAGTGVARCRSFATKKQCDKLNKLI